MIDLVLDIGQTSARARLIRDGATAGSIEALPGFVSGSGILHAISEGVALTAAEFGLTTIDRVAAGCTGLFGRSPEPSELGHHLHERFDTRLLRVADDGITAFLGAFDGHQGALVAAGTGIVAFAWGPMGTARADGVGAMIGDNGAGWWIGREGLISAISSHDGRSGGSDMLLRAAEKRYGPIELIPEAIAAAHSQIGTVAAFAIDVADAARAGDSVAKGIWTRSAGFIANAVTAVAHRAGLGQSMHWTLQGNIARSIDLLEPALSDLIRSSYPSAQLRDAKASPLEGVARLLELQAIGSFAPMAAEYKHPG